MLKKSILYSIVCISVLVFFVLGCRKDNVITDDPSDKLSFSTDSILFDTVFTTIGSITQKLMVYNTASKKINISSIELAGGSSSFFRMNVDGISTTLATDIEIAPDDSLYIFIEVTVDPQNSNNPLVITDSIVFKTNGNIQDIDLVAWGQDAHFIVADTFQQGLPPYKIIVKEGENITWQNDKPYVIYGYAVVDSTGQLNIEHGCRIHFHNSSGLWVYKGGSIKVNGTKDFPVTFQGDRLESYYKDIPGQWDRIWLNEGSVDNEFNYAIIKNAFIGIQAETFDTQMGNQLKLDNTIISNMSGVGILARDYKITSTNSVVANCGQYVLALSQGGDYDFRHCTFANYWNYTSRQTPTLILNNYYEDIKGDIVVKSLVNAYFGNCIIYGNIDEEIMLDKHPNSLVFNYKFDHCLIKTLLNTSDINFYVDCKINSDPKFKDFSENDYELEQTSPAVDAGSTLINIPVDLNGKNRDANPDIGAYEYVPD